MKELIYVGILILGIAIGYLLSNRNRVKTEDQGVKKSDVSRRTVDNEILVMGENEENEE